MLKALSDRRAAGDAVLQTSCVFLAARARLCTDLLPASSRAAGYIHIGLVGQVPAYRACNQRTKRHFTHRLQGLSPNITDLV